MYEVVTFFLKERRQSMSKTNEKEEKRESNFSILHRHTFYTLYRYIILTPL